MTTSRHEQKSWVLSVLLAWAVPGLGHWYLGRRGKAKVFFIFILGLFLVGLGLGQWKVVEFPDLVSIGQVLTGAVALAAQLLGHILRSKFGPANPVPVSFEMGTLYTLVAGLLNLLVVLDAYLVAKGIRRSTQQKGV
jgi:TM2 domain-containing membrane protein YozV